MDHAWAAQQLREFLDYIDALRALQSMEGQEYDDLVATYGPSDAVVDRLVTLNPVMIELMGAARPDLGRYTEYPSGEWSINDSPYWLEYVRPLVLRAIGIHELVRQQPFRV
jgi:hypothetical protein